MAKTKEIKVTGELLIVEARYGKFSADIVAAHAKKHGFTEDQAIKDLARLIKKENLG